MPEEKPKKRKPRNPRPRNPTIPVRIPVDLHRRLAEWAARDERSINWAAKKAVEQFLAQKEKEQDPPAAPPG
jgi:predicted transcriptional regulator